MKTSDNRCLRALLVAACAIVAGCLGADGGTLVTTDMPDAASEPAATDAAIARSSDGSTRPPPAPDMTPAVDHVGPNGCTVDLLHFGLSGDTRPPACGDTAGYPTAIIDAIGDAMQAKNVQFALDLGDHMFVCNDDLSVATKQMKLFTDGTAHYDGTWFMTMGNHECTATPCLPGSRNANFVAFSRALAPISSLPYYDFHVHTSLGLATFVVIADNSWDATQQAWLESTLTKADSNAMYTIIARHHPEGDTSVTTNPDIVKIIHAHKFALSLAGHTHTYKHLTSDGGRAVVMGNGGAPLSSGGSFNGYGIINQQTNGDLHVKVFDVVSGALMDAFTVGPN